MSSKEGLGCWWLQPSLFSSVYVKTSPERSENFGHVTGQPCGPPKRRKRDPFLPRCTTNPRPRRQRATFPAVSLGSQRPRDITSFSWCLMRLANTSGSEKRVCASSIPYVASCGNNTAAPARPYRQRNDRNPRSDRSAVACISRAQPLSSVGEH